MLLNNIFLLFNPDPELAPEANKLENTRTENVFVRNLLYKKNFYILNIYYDSN